MNDFQFFFLDFSFFLENGQPRNRKDTILSSADTICLNVVSVEFYLQPIQVIRRSIL